jgi:hypothetical protein
MNTNLLEFVLGNLDRRQPKWAEVSRGTGVPYDTLKKIATRITPNPGVRHIQKLADYFLLHGHVDTAQAATESVANGGANV